MLILALVAFSFSSNSQTEEKKKKSVSKKQAQHTEERFQADAMAIAYIRCKADLVSYELGLDDKNRQLKSEFQTTTILRNNLEVKMLGKYAKDTVRNESFLKEINKASQSLNVCIEYRGILDSIAGNAK